MQKEMRDNTAYPINKKRSDCQKFISDLTPFDKNGPSDKGGVLK